MALIIRLCVLLFDRIMPSSGTMQTTQSSVVDDLAQEGWKSHHTSGKAKQPAGQRGANEPEELFGGNMGVQKCRSLEPSSSPNTENGTDLGSHHGGQNEAHGVTESTDSEAKLLANGQAMRGRYSSLAPILHMSSA